jgi:type IV pilus biogenesis protein CpaD/CtpE
MQPNKIVRVSLRPNSARLLLWTAGAIALLTIVIMAVLLNRQAQSKSTVTATLVASPTSTTLAVVTSPTAEPTRDTSEDQIFKALSAASGAGKVTAVRYDGQRVLEVDFKVPPQSDVPHAAQAARDEVRALLTALEQLQQPFVHATISGFYDLPDQADAIPVKVDYLADVVKATDWANLPDAQLYDKADIKIVSQDFATAK